MATHLNYQKASHHAGDIARWAMYVSAVERPEDSVFHGIVHMSLEECAAALGYKLVKADAPATGAA